MKNDNEREKLAAAVLRADAGTPHKHSDPAKSERAKPPQKPKPQLQDFDGEAIYEANFPEPEFIIDGFLPMGLTLLPGRPKVGKSWLALQLAISVATSTPFCGQLAVKEPGKVLYLGLEEPKRRTNTRMKRLYTGDTYLLQNIRFVYQIQPLMAGGFKMLDDYLTDNPVRLVIIDTFLALVGANNRSDVLRSEYAEVNSLRELADKHKVAMVIVHHTRKMGGDAIDTVAGTTGITAGSDAIWALKKQNDTVTLELRGRELEDKTYGLRLQTGDDFGWIITGEGAEVALSDERQEILTLLRDEAPLKPAKIALLLKKNANTTRVLLQRLLFEGFVRKNDRGEYLLTLTPVNSVNGVNE